VCTRTQLCSVTRQNCEKAQFHVTVTVNKVLCIHSSDEVDNYITTLISTDQQGGVLNLMELFEQLSNLTHTLLRQRISWEAVDFIPSPAAVFLLNSSVKDMKIGLHLPVIVKVIVAYDFKY